MEEIEEMYRRMIFNIMARNHDDHAKNIAFLMDRAGRWSLSPAYDLTFAYNPTGTWTQTHQLTVAGKRDGFEWEDLKECARAASLKRGRAEAIVGEVRQVVERWPDYADDAGVRPEHRDHISKVLHLAPLA
jgi:serine/threonine-protein kinase HipA